MSDCTHQAPGDELKPLPKVRLEQGQDVVAQQTLLGIVKECVQTLTRRQRGRRLLHAQQQDGDGMLGNREGQLPFGMPTPTIGAGQAGRQVLVVPGHRVRVEQVEALAGLQQHSGVVGCLDHGCAPGPGEGVRR